MRLLSNEATLQVSGGGSKPSKASYQGSANFWSIVGLFSAAANLSSIPNGYGQYFAVRAAAVGLGATLGYVFGAVEYSLYKGIESYVDYYLSPEEE